MANDKHVALLKKGVAAWNEWRAKNPDIRPDLREANFSKADLNRADLTCTNLSGAMLNTANLSEANLTFANLSFANLSWAHLGGARLSKFERGAALRLASFQQ